MLSNKVWFVSNGQGFLKLRQKNTYEKTFFTRLYATLCAMDSKNIPPHMNDMAKFNAKLEEIGPVPRFLFAAAMH